MEVGECVCVYVCVCGFGLILQHAMCGGFMHVHNCTLLEHQRTRILSSAINTALIMHLCTYNNKFFLSFFSTRCIRMLANADCMEVPKMPRNSINSLIICRGKEVWTNANERQQLKEKVYQLKIIRISYIIAHWMAHMDGTSTSSCHLSSAFYAHCLYAVYPITLGASTFYYYVCHPLIGVRPCIDLFSLVPRAFHSNWSSAASAALRLHVANRLFLLPRLLRASYRAHSPQCISARACALIQHIYWIKL